MSAQWPKLSDYQRAEAVKRRAAGEMLAAIAKRYGVDISMISRLCLDGDQGIMTRPGAEAYTRAYRGH